MKNEVYEIEGMTCAACSSAVERVIRKLNGVENAQVNLITKKLIIKYDDTKVTPEMIISKVKRAGFQARLEVFDQDKKPKEVHQKNSNDIKRRKQTVIAAVVFMALMLYLTMLPMFFPSAPTPRLVDRKVYPVNHAIIQLLLTTYVLFLGRRFYTRGFHALLKRNPNMDSLIALGSGSAYLYSVVITFLIVDYPHLVYQLYFESAAVVVALVMLGKYLEAKSNEKTTDSIRRLMELAPETAFLEDKQGLREVPAESLKIGDIILVRPGMRIAADGIIIKGHSAIDESMLTGESMPREKGTGSQVYCGSVNTSGLLHIQVQKMRQDTILSSIVRFVEEAQGKKAPISKLADQISGVFVPIVIVIALISAAFWAFSGKSTAFVLQVFVSVMVIACPCAMGLATPTAILVGTGVGAKHGILVRSGETLEKMGKVKTVLLDKTGTLTRGIPTVDTIWVNHGTEADLLKIAYHLEQASEHPLAKAVVRRTPSELIGVDDYIVNVQETPGRGMGGSGLKGEKYLLGNQNHLLEAGIDLSIAQTFLNDASVQGHSIVLISKNDTLLGGISFSDPLREEAFKLIGNLQQKNIKTVLLSGDRVEAVKTIANKLGISAYHSGVLPEDKAAIVEKYQTDGMVMMVGDGINDAPALALADVGCAVGSGTDIAIETADVVIMNSNMMNVAHAIQLSRATIRNIKQNLAWAFIYNIIGIPVAAGVLYLFGGPLLNPMLGGLAMSLSSFSVISNALRLNKQKFDGEDLP